MSLALRYRAHSEIGLVRKNNQDSAYVSPTMLVVADGMGGAAAGDLASAVAIKELRAVDGDHTGEDMLTALDDAVSNAAAQIAALVKSDQSLDGMGSTVCGLMFDGANLGLANIGDSRAYRYRDGALTRLTRDHSWVQTLVDEGRITEAEALEHPHRSLILRVINGQPQHLPDLELADAVAGDRLLICSDGLCGMVTDAMIEAELNGELDEVMPRLIELAHAAGGADNITIVLADIVDGERTGATEVLGAAAHLDLDAPFDTTTMQLPTLGEEVDEDPTVLAERVRYAPTTKGRVAAWLKVTIAVVLTLALISGGLSLWYSYTQRQYYVGPEEAKVAIFRGVPDAVLNLPLSTLVELDSTRLDDLPPYYQEQVRATIAAESLESARSIVMGLRLKARECIAQREERAQVTQPPTPVETTAPTTSESPTADATTPSNSPSPGPSPAMTSPTTSPTQSPMPPPAPEEC
ncbi:MAG: protein phosphatase 2C domain-containing protein [Propionibacteriaceae bacterium]|nr:protein phosphatase 2C domain-containing protein [Propionibacteriaceae bacterium]